MCGSDARFFIAKTLYRPFANRDMIAAERFFERQGPIDGGRKNYRTVDILFPIVCSFNDCEDRYLRSPK